MPRISSPSSPPRHPKPSILTINVGSSSIRYALYSLHSTTPLHEGRLERIGMPGTVLVGGDARERSSTRRKVPSSGRLGAVEFLITWLEAQPFFESVQVVGHRLVFGMRHHDPQLVTPSLLKELHRLSHFAPDHLPREIEIIEKIAQRHPELRQVACFDTAFHRKMPLVARLIPIPRHYAAKGVERYGFHGLSYSFLIEELRRLRDPSVEKGRVILAHLGTGASLAAIRDGQSVDTTMGFTPASGLVMGTRSGDLDPGLIAFLAHSERMTPARFNRMVNNESGLLGVSGSSADMQELCTREKSDARAAEAVELFCYQARKGIGSFAAVLGGLDTLVFCGGIGENSPEIRGRICEGLEFLGIRLKSKRNDRNADVISKHGSAVRVRVIRTNEALMIARSVLKIIKPPLAENQHRPNPDAY